ncbi:MAG: DNA primase [Clostridia bacterium]|nr:DNA primase [Clostridia bacterium]
MKITHNGMTTCPFHEDRDPSMKLNERYYYCFGCLVSGDVIDLTAQLLQLSKRQAADRLAADFHLTDSPSAVQTTPAKTTCSVQSRLSELRSVLLAYEATLKKQQAIFAPAAPEDEIDQRYVAACNLLEGICYLIDSLIFGTAEEKEMTLAAFHQDGLKEQLEEYIQTLIQEEQHAIGEQPFS